MRVFIDYRSRTPIYEQIKEQIIKLINCGELKSGDQLQSLRQLSSELSININTVKRALSELEDQGIVYSVAGKGVFIADAPNSDAFLTSSLETVETAITNAKVLGVQKSDILKLIENIYKADH